MNRRTFMGCAVATAVGFGSLRYLLHGEDVDMAPASSAEGGYGPLLPDPNGLLDLPRGFSYQRISEHGQRMDDGLFVPAYHDGMGTFAGPDGTTILVRNHEVGSHEPPLGPFGKSNELLDRVDRSKIFDRGAADRPMLGGTTTLVYDTRQRRLLKHFLSLTGTCRNCAGGVTPWSSWISCEESMLTEGPDRARRHGYNFEVPATDRPGLVRADPLPAMGRFNHEAVAVDPRTGIVYQTEDQNDSLIYRFIPDRPGGFLRSGRLQALAVRTARGAGAGSNAGQQGPGQDMRNWLDEHGRPKSDRVLRDQPVDVQWVDLEAIDSPNDDLRIRGFESGAARFARGEGMWHGSDAIYFVSTTGGSKGLGQIWRYRPSRFEGSEGELEHPGQLVLMIEPNDATLVQNADNLTVAPWGDLFICEDGPDDDRLVQVTATREIFTFAHNRLNDDELAGAVFSPDGTTLFVNIQGIGVTLAITGPWASEQVSM
jgi:secreted PhoX family phosphatase